ncbi:hypothetical protein NKH85_29610 [Mesorhizobium sp. M0924]|uniref:DUF6894 family protein n=1 Tax=unclassified Mesorhizobium TaxID=325217 RepID=UPI00333A1CD4
MAKPPSKMRVVVPYSKAARGIHLAYTFYYRDGDQARQVPPAETPSFEAARAEAIRCVIGLLADLGDDDMTGWLVRMRDQAGNELCTISVCEAEAAPQTETSRLGSTAHVCVDTPALIQLDRRRSELL